jgi:hypothetical protein
VLIEHNTLRTQHYSILNLVRFEDPERASYPFQNLHGLLICVGVEIVLDTTKNSTIPAFLLGLIFDWRREGYANVSSRPFGSVSTAFNRSSLLKHSLRLCITSRTHRNIPESQSVINIQCGKSPDHQSWPQFALQCYPLCYPQNEDEGLSTRRVHKSQCPCSRLRVDPSEI